jgi:hypothetical protein
MTTTPDGFEALGHPVPNARKEAAYRALKQMIPGVTTQDAMELVGRVADHLARDEPYAAMHTASGGAPLGRNPDTTPLPTDRLPKVALDVTGSYRLLAHLLTGPSS